MWIPGSGTGVPAGVPRFKAPVAATSKNEAMTAENLLNFLAGAALAGLLSCLVAAAVIGVMALWREYKKGDP